jgi:hypothetical protein
MENIYSIMITIATAALLSYLLFSHIRRGRAADMTEQNQQEQWLKLPQNARKGEKRVNNGPVCDMCSQPLDLSQAYFATTEQVITKPAYWEFVFSGQWSYVYRMDPRGDIIGQLVQQQAKLSSTWGLCESCSHILPIDHAQAREYAIAKTNPIPGVGPADTSRAAAAASAAWIKLYGAVPTSIKFE